VARKGNTLKEPPLYRAAPKLTEEYRIRQHALHLALCVRRTGDKLVLRERYADGGYRPRRRPADYYKQIIGTYRTWRAVDRALDRYMDAELKRIDADKRRSKRAANPRNSCR
jgi:hypothetical protein